MLQKNFPTPTKLNTNLPESVDCKSAVKLFFAPDINCQYFRFISPLRNLFNSSPNFYNLYKQTNMKKMLIIMAGMIVLACNNQTDTESKVTFSDLVAGNLKGDISSVEEIPYKVDSAGKMGDMDSCCIEVTDYDVNGNTTKEVRKDSKGTVTGEDVFTRHPNGLFKSDSYTEKGKSGEFDTKIDDKGNYTWAGVIDSNGKADIYYTDITQNEVGEVTGWKQYDKDSVLRQTGESTYDGHFFMGSTTKDSVGNIKNTNTAKRNDKGEQIESSNTTITKDSTTIKVTKYTYESHDEMGNWTHRTTWDDKGKATKMTMRKYTYRNKEVKK